MTTFPTVNYNIKLLRKGNEVVFDFPPATADKISKGFYLEPLDARCQPAAVRDEQGVKDALAAVLGKGYTGRLDYTVTKGAVIELHGTAILGYQRQDVIDPRLVNKIGTVWEVYIDKRIFPQADENAWFASLGQLISTELLDDKADASLADKIKIRLLQDAEARA